MYYIIAICICKVRNRVCARQNFERLSKVEVQNKQQRLVFYSYILEIHFKATPIIDNNANRESDRYSHERFAASPFIIASCDILRRASSFLFSTFSHQDYTAEELLRYLGTYIKLLQVFFVFFDLGLPRAADLFFDIATNIRSRRPLLSTSASLTSLSNPNARLQFSALHHWLNKDATIYRLSIFTNEITTND